MWRAILTLFAFSALLQACETTDYEGFKRWNGSIHVKLVALGDEDQRIQSDQFLSLSISLQDLQGNVVALKHVERVSFEKASWPEPIKGILLDKGNGDELAIRGRADELGIAQWFAPLAFDVNEQVYELWITVDEVFSSEELRQVRAEERMVQDRELEALQCMERALDSLGLGEDDFIDGIYFEYIQRGNGGRPESGKVVRVHYRTHLCDGRLIDDTERTEALEYPVGKPDQVLPGFAVAISKMRVGDAARFLIPPAMAFADKGSSSGIVPPHNALIYEAVLLDVR